MKKFEFLQFEDEKASIRINNINEKVGTIKLELRDVEYAEYRVCYSDKTTDQYIALKEKTYTKPDYYFLL